MTAGKVRIDAYLNGAQGSDATNFNDGPPAVAAPLAGTASVLQLYVPSEHTELDYGAGTLPGIRMATDRHVHLTARTPLTTISLGTPGG